VKKYIDAQKLGFRGDKSDEVALRRVLPENLMTDLLCEARIPILVAHQLLWDMNKVYPRTTRQIAKEAISSSTYAPCDMVFTAGDAGERMLFIDSGKMAYRYGVSSAARQSKVSQGSREAPGVRIVTHMDWVGEAALWMVWEHKGELTSVNACALLELAVDAFAEVVVAHSSVLLEMARYAEQFSMLLATREPSDIMDVPPHSHWELGAPFRGSTISCNAGQVEVTTSRGPGHALGAARSITNVLSTSSSRGSLHSNRLVHSNSKDRSGAVTLSADFSAINRSVDASLRTLSNRSDFKAFGSLQVAAMGAFSESSAPDRAND